MNPLQGCRGVVKCVCVLPGGMTAWVTSATGGSSVEGYKEEGRARYAAGDNTHVCSTELPPFLRVRTTTWEKLTDASMFVFC